MFSRIELKAKAKKQLRNNYFGCFVWLFLAPFALSFFSSMVSFSSYRTYQIFSSEFHQTIVYSSPFIGLFSLLLSIALTVMTTKFVLEIVARNDRVPFEAGYQGLTLRHFGKYIIVNLLLGLIIGLGFLLFLIPGIIFSYMFIFVPYIVIENPEMGIFEIFSKSREMTKGNKFDIFVLELSFILWGLFGIITCGLGMVFVIPYMQLTYANCYKTLKTQQKA